MGKNMWSPGSVLPLLLLFLLLGCVSSSPMVNGDGLLLRKTGFDLLSSAPATASVGIDDYPSRLTRRAVSGSGPSPSDGGKMAPSYYCSQSGFFAEYGSCSNYYQCEEISDPGIFTAYLFTCPSGMVFDNIMETCDLASQVTTRPECMAGETKDGAVSINGPNSIDLLADVSIEKSHLQKRQKRSEKTNTDQCSVEQMESGTNEICNNVGNIEDYVNLVMRMIPLKEYHDDNENVTKILADYDRDLGEAQDHAKVWRDGESIIGAIGKTITLAKDFEPEFQKKYKTNLERVETIKANVDEEQLINIIKQDIKLLEERIKNMTDLMKLLPEAAKGSFQFLVDGLEVELAEKQRKLEEDFVLYRTLDELIGFLEFVSTDAYKIRTAATETRTRIEDFRIKLEGDETAFKRHLNVSKITLEKHKNETIKNNKKLEDINKKIMENERKIEEERENIKTLRKNITATRVEAFELRSKILKRGPSTKEILGYVFLIIPFIGGPLLASANSDEQARLKELGGTADAAQASLDALQADADSGDTEIARLQQAIISGSTNSMNIKSTLHDYTLLNRDLRVMQGQLSQLIPAIEKALTGVDSIHCVFSSVIDKLKNMIDFAKEAKTNAEKRDVVFFTYSELDKLKTNWNGAYEQIMNLDMCSGLKI